MLNFKKKGIFTRQVPKEDASPEQEPQEGILAVWGSPGSGKTVTAVKLAKHLADRKKNVVLLLCDMTAPMLPCICPPSELQGEHSLGSILAAAHVTEPLIKHKNFWIICEKSPLSWWRTAAAISPTTSFPPWRSWRPTASCALQTPI